MNTWLERLVQDVLYATRSLWRSKGYTAAACGTLTLGLGASTAVFSVVDVVLLRPLAYPEADQLHSVYSTRPSGGILTPSYPDFADLRREVTSSELTFVRGLPLTLATDLGGEQVLGAAVSPGFFDVLQTRPVRGRSFTPEEEEIGRPVLVLSYGLWRGRFGGDPDVIGRTLNLDGLESVVLGVMPQGVEFPSWAEVWLPLRSIISVQAGLDDRALRVDGAVLARVAGTSTPEAAEEELRGVAQRLAQEYPDTNAEIGASLRPLRDLVLGDSGRQLGLLTVAVILVLLLACANVANLTLARGIARSPQLAVRSALGATRGRIAQQLTVEMVLLAAVAGGLGFAFAVWSVNLFRVWGGANLPRLEELSVDARMVMLGALVSAVGMLLAGAVPALITSRRGTAVALRSGTVGERGAVSRHVRSGLVVIEVALALTLLHGSGLLLRSLMEVRSVDMGFDADRLATVRIFPPSPRYDDPEAALALYRQLEETISAIPGVESVGLINHMPSVGGRIATRVVVSGRVELPEEEVVAGYRVVSPTYVDAAGLTILVGSQRVEQILTQGTVSLMVNERLARTLWPNELALRKQITVFRQSPDRANRGEAITGEIVAVVGNVRANGPEQEPVPEVYVPLNTEVWGNITIVVRARDMPSELVGAIRQSVQAIDPSMPVARPATVSDDLSGWRTRRRQVIGILAAFALLAVVIAGAGVYAVTSFLVRERYREFGIRMALGASPLSVLSLVLRGAAGLGISGTVIGLLAGLGMVRVISSELFGVTPTDPTVLGGVSVLLFVVVLSASYFPAIRAAACDPSASLRDS